MPVLEWDQVPREQMNPVVARQVIHGERITVARIYLSQGAVVPPHSHDNEQITLLERGKLRFEISGETHLIEPGQVVRIPPNAPHRVEALEDSLAVDLFSPIREDWIRGDDAYLRR